MMAMCLVSPHKAFAIDFPGDTPTIEALINLHKLIKSEEDDAMARIATSFGEQSLVTKGAKAFCLFLCVVCGSPQRDGQQPL